MSTEIWLVRHAEDLAASEGRYGDEGLSARGREQARALAAALGPVPFARCLCSPLRRARETAEIAIATRDVPIAIERCLAEGEIGALAGLDRRTARETHPDDLRLGASVVPRLRASGRTAPGGETRDAFLLRVDAAARLIDGELERAGRPVLLISHGGLLDYLLQRLLGMPLRDEVPFGFDHCGAVRLVRHREEPAFGPFSMLRFVAP